MPRSAHCKGVTFRRPLTTVHTIGAREDDNATICGGADAPTTVQIARTGRKTARSILALVLFILILIIVICVIVHNRTPPPPQAYDDPWNQEREEDEQQQLIH
jgi:hypothetical protein